MIKINILILLFLLAGEVIVYAKQSVSIGVLAHKNFSETESMWNPTALYLNEKIPEYEFHILPLRFEEFPLYLRDNKIDFVVTNSAYYVELENRFGISRIATLKNRGLDGNAQTQFGGVIFTKASNTEISSLEDMVGKQIAAVNPDSFGGWIMALRELKGDNLSLNQFTVTFYGTHEAVVYAVQSGKADAGTVRTDTLERMDKENKIEIDDFTVINPKKHPAFFYQCSTALYPEWPFATTRHTSGQLAEKVAIALISMPEHSEAALKSKSAGWTIPLDYQSIHECLKELELGPYAQLKKAAISYFVKKYGVYILIGTVLLLVSLIVLSYIAKVNGRLREAKRVLNNLNRSLEEKIAEKTRHLYDKSAKLEEAYLNEKYLRSILRTVADINQMLITTRSKEELIEKATLCLSSNEAFKSAKISIVEDGVLVVGAAYGVVEDNSVTDIDRLAFDEGKNIMITSFDEKVPSDCKNKAEYYKITAMYALLLKRSNYGDPMGVLTICTAHRYGFSAEEQNMLEELAGDIGFALHSFSQHEQISLLNEERLKNYQNFIDALVNMIEQRDTYTAGHTQRVAHYAELIAREMELPEKEIQRLVEAAKLHDIGKVVTPDSILLKPGHLSVLEYELIKEHVAAGYKVLSTVNFYQEMAQVMLDHHERYDGSGYPKGKKGGEIPLLGSILAVADSFDAMTTNRIYKPRKEVAESLIELNALSGKMYHPAVVNAASKVLSGITIDASISQFGSSALEEERLSYFFKDKLTKLYNEDYFTMTLNGRSEHAKPETLCIVSLVDFHHFNKRYGWEKGNELIALFAAYLSEKLPEYMIFRLWGDHFAIADFNGDIEAILAKSPLNEKGVAAKTKMIVTIPDNLEDLMHNETTGNGINTPLAE
ncbi:MAG: PhnD/SsuA/transferrin family substrate-binding protein [Sulfuricurvum sp.]|jgi:putative nucleotidyltransferase with HDIG domain|uniref:PhnD/SsuA/transferrin family substrate-binding protein n=1 Tax=Sulfuricurvum sp. TaxID=2025608 RepID=UPI0025F1E4B8|nr:HD domain-containing phosphohydrolase [Sulfuricurvum sp.]MCK9374013.1 PhnD/SsuA/transferrin family substrate-binding protein [Sulfuricurvum sp.]